MSRNKGSEGARISQRPRPGSQSCREDRSFRPRAGVSPPARLLAFTPTSVLGCAASARGNPSADVCGTGHNGIGSSIIIGNRHAEYKRLVPCHLPSRGNCLPTGGPVSQPRGVRLSEPSNSDIWACGVGQTPAYLRQTPAAGDTNPPNGCKLLAFGVFHWALWISESGFEPRRAMVSPTAPAIGYSPACQS